MPFIAREPGANSRSITAVRRMENGQMSRRHSCAAPKCRGVWLLCTGWCPEVPQGKSCRVVAASHGNPMSPLPDDGDAGYQLICLKPQGPSEAASLPKDVWCGEDNDGMILVALGAHLNNHPALPKTPFHTLVRYCLLLLRRLFLFSFFFSFLFSGPIPLAHMYGSLRTI